jgi:integrase
MKVTLRTRELKDGRISYYLDVYHRGQRKTEWLNLYLNNDKQQNKETTLLANKIRANREVELQNNTYGFIPDFKRRANFVEYFEQYANKKNSSVYFCTLAQLKAFCKNGIDFQSINIAWLEDFQNFILSRVSSNTAHSYYMLLKSSFKQAIKDKIINSNPADDVPNIKKQEIKRDFLVLSEIELLAKTECPKQEVKRAFLFACFTGLRISDIFDLTWNKIRNDQIEIRQIKTKGILYLPLSKTAKNILNIGIDNVDYPPDQKVFNLPHKVHLNNILKQWAHKAELDKNLHFHIARHTFATLNLTSGSQIYTVSKLLGHKELRSTEIYSRIIDETKKKAIDLLPEINIA